MSYDGCHQYAEKGKVVCGTLPREIDDERGDGVKESGFGLGYPGLAAPTLPSRSMVVPPLNFARVRGAFLLMHLIP